MSAPWRNDSDAPAPWVAEEDETHVIVRDADGGLVADCTDGFDGDDGWVMADKAAHIARLVAAAPEFLSSAENFLKWFRVFVGESGFAEINCEELRTLQDAIAKATEAA